MVRSNAPALPENIVYCVSSIQKIIDLKLDFIFTDGHAVDSFSLQYSADQIENIDKVIDLTAINAKYWRADNDLDLKRRKEAEFLVLGDIPIDAIIGYGVYNEAAKEKLISFGVDKTKVIIKENFYF